MTGTIDVVVLASGFSRRFGGENKLVQVFHGKPLIRHVLDLAVDLGLGGKVFLIYSAPETLAAAGESGAQAIRNERPGRGLCESVRLGVAASTADYYLFVHGDQPLLDHGTVAAIVSRRRHGRIVTPCHGGSPGNPTLFSSFFRRELLELADGDSPRVLKSRHADRVDMVEIDSPRALRDVDTVEDFRRLEEML